MKNQRFSSFFAVLGFALGAVCCLTGAVQLVDPTRPPEALLSGSKNTSLTGPLQVLAVFIYHDRRIAYINNQFVKVGDKIGTYTVINIQRDTVELKDSQNATVTLPLLPTVKTVVVDKKG